MEAEASSLRGPSPSRWLERAAWLSSLACVPVWLLHSRNRYFNQDELQHLHIISQIYRHHVPYRDFFEHHTLLFNSLSAPLLSWFGETPETPLAFRAVMLGLTALIAAATGYVARRLFGRPAAALSVLLLLTTDLFIYKAIEVRPEPLSVLLELVAIGALACELSRLPAKPPRPARLFGVGLALGLALLTTQKAVFTALGVAVVLLLAIVATADRRPLGFGGLALVGGGCLPLAVNAGVLWAQGALGAFVHDAILLSFSIKWRGSSTFARGQGDSPWDVVYQLLAPNFLLAVLAAVGLGRTVRESWRSPRRFEVLALVIPAASMAVGLLLQSRAFAQFWMRLVPLLCIFAAQPLAELARQPWPKSGLPALRGSGLAWLGVGFGLFMLAPSAGYRWNSLSGLQAAWGTAVCLGLACLAAWGGRPRLQELALLAAVVAWPLDSMLGELWQRPPGGGALVRVNTNQEQLAKLRFIMSHSQPDDRVLDGVSGYGAFREHTYFYWHLNRTVLGLLTADELGPDFLRAVRERPPKFFIFDSATQSLDPGIRDLALQLGAVELDD